MEGDSVEIQAEVDHTEQQSKKGKPDTIKGAGSKAGRKRKQRELPSPTSDRPTRERKSIERLIVSPDKEIKEFKIPKGSGTALKDIPNIVFKLSKRRGGDEVVQALHKVLFGRTAKHAGKANILQFSGFVWSGNEEKEKVKIKDRLERVVKETLFQISDLLDLKLSKALKKDDGVLKVLEFLESPHKTSDKLAESAKKKGKKTMKKSAKGAKKGRTPAKSPKGNKKTPRKKQDSDEEDEGDAADSEDEERDVEEEPVDMEEEPVDMEEEPEEKDSDDYNDRATSKTKRKRKSTKEQLKEESEDDDEASPKKRKVQKEKRKHTPKPKKEKKPRSKAEKVKEPKVKEPSDEDLKLAISEILQNVDFSKVTFTDVMKQLGEKFKVDLTHRRSDLKTLIQDEIARLVGEGDNEDEDSNTEGDDKEKLSSRERIKEVDDEDGDGDGDGDVEDSVGEDEDGKDEKADEDGGEDINSVEDKICILENDGGDHENAQIGKEDAEAEAEDV